MILSLSYSVKYFILLSESFAKWEGSLQLSRTSSGNLIPRPYMTDF